MGMKMMKYIYAFVSGFLVCLLIVNVATAKELSKEYYASGELKRKSVFYNGKGIARHYYENGQLRTKVVLDREGDGFIKAYFENGKLQGEWDIRNWKPIIPFEKIKEQPVNRYS